MARRREANVFSLSFLDVMSCGFGAVILIYIIINHATETHSQEVNEQLMAEVTRIEEQVEDETAHLVQLKNTLEVTEDEIITTEGLVLKVIQQIRELEAEIESLRESGSSQTDSIEILKAELKRLEEDAASLEGSVAGDETSGSSLRSIVGEGDRQYLTGLKIGGQHILILVDASASMLDETIVNVVRRRNLPDEQKLASEKWQRAIRTVEWITANMPKDARFQLVTFNTDAKSIVPDSGVEWLEAIDRASTDAAMDALKKVIPKGGTSLHAALSMSNQFEPKPDNVFLIVDSLPTQGQQPARGSVVQSRQRVGFFSDAMNLLPIATPFNIILFPMEGDPLAAPSYWRMAQATGGSFLSPPRDWP